MARSTPASVKSVTGSGPRFPGTAAGRRMLAGGMDRAGGTSNGRGGATCRRGMGEGRGWLRRFAGSTRAGAVAPWVLRAGAAARARLTRALVFKCLADTVVLFLRWTGRFFGVPDPVGLRDTGL